MLEEALKAGEGWTVEQVVAPFPPHGRPSIRPQTFKKRKEREGKEKRGGKRRGEDDRK